LSSAITSGHVPRHEPAYVAQAKPEVERKTLLSIVGRHVRRLGVARILLLDEVHVADVQ
jgi:hypothetical protein